MNNESSIEPKEIRFRKFRFQKKCQGLCRSKTFSCVDDKQKYCKPCAKEIQRLQTKESIRKKLGEDE